MSSLSGLVSTYVTKWKGGNYPCGGNTAYVAPGTMVKEQNVPNTWAAPRGSSPGWVLNDTKCGTHETLKSCPREGSSCCNKFNPNPIRHYRKAYTSNPCRETGGRKGPHGKTPIGTMDIPGGTIFRSSCEKGCCGLSVTSSYSTKTNIDTTCGNKGSCGTSGKALTRVRNGTTSGTKYCNSGRNSYMNSEGDGKNRYCADTRSYLKARCRSFASKSATTRPCGKPLPGEECPEYVGDSPRTCCYRTGCTVDASTGKSKCCSKTYHKPCNYKFARNTAVDSSTRTLNLNKQTVDKAASSLKTKFGDAASAASAYSSRKGAPYINKSNFAVCSC